MTKAKHFILYLMAVMLAVGIAGCKKESEEVKQPTPQDKPTPGPEKPDDGKTDKPFGDLPESVHIFEQVVPVEKTQIISVSSDTVKQHYSITYKGEVPQIKPGNVVCVEDGDETRIILVTNSSVSGNTVEMDGPLGDLSYVFFDTEFIITDMPEIVKETDVAVFTPSSVEDFHPEQSLPKISKATKYPKVDSLKATPIFGGDIDKEENTTSFSVKYGVELGTKISFDENLSIAGKLTDENTLGFKIYNKYSGKETEKFGNTSFSKSQYIDKGFSLIGSVSLALSATAKLEKELNGGDDKLGGSEIDLFPAFGKKVRVLVGWFPVKFYVGMDFLADLDLSIKAGVESKFELSLELNGEFGAGMSDKGDFFPIVETSVDLKPKFTTSTYGAMSLKAAPIYPMIYVMFLGKKVLGIGAKVKPQINVDLGVNLQQVGKPGDPELGKSGCSFDVSGGLYLELGTCRRPTWFEETFKSDVEDKWSFTSMVEGKQENGKWSLAYSPKGDGQVELKKWILYQSPYSLSVPKIYSDDIVMALNKDYKLETEHNSSIWDVDAQDLKTTNIVYFPVEKGKKISVDLQVISKVVGFELGVMPAIVCVKTKTKNDMLFSSKQTYEWIPESDNDYLELSVYDHMKQLKGYCKIMRRPVDGLLRITAIEDSKVFITNPGYINCEYNLESEDDWKSVNNESQVVLEEGKSMWLRGYNIFGLNSKQGGLNIAITGKANIDGDLMGLIDYGFDGGGIYDLVAPESFRGLFKGSTGLVDASGLKLPDFTQEGICAQLFMDCTKLTKAPKLEATQLSPGCYDEMFSGCSSLKSLEVSFLNWNGWDKSYGAGTNVGIGNDNDFFFATVNWLKGVSPTGNFICPKSLEVKIGDSYIPKGWTINGKGTKPEKDPVTYSNLKLSGGNVVQDELLELSCVFSAPCHVEVYVDGKLVKPVSLSLVYSIELPTSVAGNHECRFVATNDGDTVVEKTFSYTVTSKPTETDASVTPTLPDVSGSGLSDPNRGTGTAPDVKGQDIDQTYNGSTPDVKGENLDQIYNGSGSAPDVKGTNL